MKKIKLILIFGLIGVFLDVSCSFGNDNYTELVWSRQIGSYDGYTQGLAITNDVDDNIYVTGITNVGISEQSKKGSFDLFLVKYDKNGNLIWTHELGKSGGYVYGRAVVTDKQGNIYLSGMTNVNVFGESQIGIYDYFIAKYDTNGNKIWSKQIGNAKYYASSFGITIDKLGNIYLVGDANASLVKESQNGKVDYFIAKYDESGDIIWTRQSGGYGGYTYAKKVTTDNKGNIYITGNTTVGLSNESQNGKIDYFIAKYNESGNMLWTKQIGGESGITKGEGIVTDILGNIYVSGYTDVAISGGVQHGVYDYFLAKYNESGNMLWTKQLGSKNGQTLSLDLGVDINKNIYLTGRTTVNLFGNRQMGNIDYFIVKYNEFGDLIFGNQIGDKNGKVIGVGLSMSDKNYIYITGYTDVGLFGQPQIGNLDYFVAKWRLY